MHVESDYVCGNAVTRGVLKKFFEENKIKYYFKKIKITDKKRDVSCFWCSWNRRKELFLAADRFRCNKVALAHHMDDIIETLLLNMFYHGEFSAMNPRQELFKGKVVVIRPLCYVEEKALKRFAREEKFALRTCKGINAEISKRRMMKRFIEKVEGHCPYVKTNIFRSISRVNKEYIQVK